MQADWYFDFISPFSYLAHERLGDLPDGLAPTPIPVLFAALLGAHGHKGPAEIPAKRRYSYRYCRWFAERHDIPFVMPPAHPFNPLAVLRLAVALDGERSTVAAIFRFIWREGRDPSDPAEWAELIERLGASDAESRIADPAVKDRLRTNTKAAIARGVFGVPTMAIVDQAGDQLFWGVESIDMLADYLADPDLFGHGEMARVSNLPMGAERRP